MSKKFLGLCLVFLVCVGIIAQTEGESLNRAVSEKLIGQIDFSSLVPEVLLKVSPDSNHVAYVAIVGNKRFVVVDGEKERQYDSITTGEGRVIFDSPESMFISAIAYKWVKNGAIKRGKV